PAQLARAHPAGCEARGGCRNVLQFHTGGTRGHDERLLPVGRRVIRRQRSRHRQRDAGSPVDSRHPLDRIGRVDGPDGRVHTAQKALRLAQRIAEEHAGEAERLITPPPGIDLVKDRFGMRPSVDRQPEGAFGDQDIARDELERLAGRIGIRLVVARHDPDLATRLDANLGRAQDVSGGLEGDLDAVDGERSAIGHRLYRDVSESGSDQRLAGFRARIRPGAPARMIGMRMSDDGPIDRTVRVDVKSTRLAVKPMTGLLEKLAHGTPDGCRADEFRPVRLQADAIVRRAEGRLRSSSCSTSSTSSRNAGSSSIRSPIVLQAWITVEWSRPPKRSPMLFREWDVIILQKYMATCRAVTISRLRVFAESSSGEIS